MGDFGKSPSVKKLSSAVVDSWLWIKIQFSSVKQASATKRVRSKNKTDFVFESEVRIRKKPHHSKVWKRH